MRSKLDDRYAAYVIAHDKEQLLALLIHAEDWLYSEEGEDATKSAYTEKLDSLKALGDPIVFRWQEHQELPRTAGLLRDAINQYMSQATSGEERYSHIEPEKLQSVVEKAATIQKWLEDQLVRQAEKAKTQPPVVTTEEIKKKREELVYFATPILTKPKPKPAPETTGPPPPKEEEPKQDSATPTPPPESGPAEPSNMDVD
jgi:heat shock 70kDa protein 4